MRKEKILTLFFVKYVSNPCILFRYMIYYLYQKRYKVTKMGKEESKKVVILRILEILARHSGEHKPLTQGEIVEILKAEFGLECERKAVGRSIECLRSAGYAVEKTTTGVYLSSLAFSKDETEFLMALIERTGFKGEEISNLLQKIRQAQGARFVPVSDGESSWKEYGAEMER